MSDTRTVRLGDIAKFQAGISFPKHLQGKKFGEVPFAKVSDISRTSKNGNIYIDTTNNFVDSEEIECLKGRTVPEGSILFAKIGEAIRLNHRVITRREMYIDNNAMAILPDLSIVDLEFLFWTIKDIDFYKISSSTTVPSIRKSEIEKLTIDLPSLETQKKIAKIRNLQHTINQKRERQQELFEEFERARFIEEFGNPITNPKGLPMVRLDDIATITTGNSPSRAHESNFGDFIEWIKSNNLGQKYATEAEEYLSETGAKKGRIAPAGSILVTCIAGSPSSIGKCSIVDRDVAFNQQINSVTPKNPKDLEFIWSQINLFPELVRNRSTGGMKGLVSKSEFSSILILAKKEGKNA